MNDNIYDIMTHTLIIVCSQVVTDREERIRGLHQNSNDMQLKISHAKPETAEEK